MALHVHSALKGIKGINYFVQLQIRLVLCVCNDCLWPNNTEKLKVGRRASACKCTMRRQDIFKRMRRQAFSQLCVSSRYAWIVLQPLLFIQAVTSIRLQKAGYQLCFIFEGKRCFLVEIWAVDRPLWPCWLSGILEASTDQSGLSYWDCFLISEDRLTVFWNISFQLSDLAARSMGLLTTFELA